MSDVKSSLLEEQSAIRRYCAAVLCVIGAVALRWLLDPVLGDNLPLSTTFGFVALSVWYGGWAPALMTALLSYLIANWLFMESRYAWSADPGSLWGIIAYLSGVLVIIGAGETMRRAQQQSHANATLAIERHHRLEAEAQERRRAEGALRESEAHYRRLIQALPAAVYTCDAQGRITLYNETAAALWGREPEVGKDLWCGSWKIYRPDGSPLPLDECPMALTLREGCAVRGEEIVIERSDGTKRHVLPNPEPMRDATGKVVGAINMLIDITDRKQGERAMAQLATIVTFSDDAIVSKNLDGIVTTWNRAAERLFGYKADEMIGQSITRLIPPDRQEEERDILSRISRGEPIEHYETVRRRKDGTELIVSLTVSPMVDPKGKVIGASKIARDITQQKRIEEVLLRSEQETARARDYAEAILRTSPVPLVVLDSDLRVNTANDAFYATFKIEPSATQGRLIYELGNGQWNIPKLRQLFEDILPKHTLFTNFEVTHEFETIGRHTMLLNARRIENKPGSQERIVLVIEDITERKGVEEALRDRDRALTTANDELIQQKTGLAEANKELQSFSYSVSHDLRAPLRTIDAYVRIVEEDHGPHLNADAQRCLDIVKKAARQAAELVDDLLEFSRLGRVGMDVRPVKMTELVQEVADDLRLIQEGRTLDLTVSDLPPCRGDWRLLKLVWTNLLMNAFKFTQYREVTQIEIGWLPDDRQADASVYYVKDNGVGFDMKYVHKLFGVFQRLHLKEEFDGTGVGLAIVQRIVHRHGGRVWAEGKIDGGATFFFSIRKALR